MSQGAQFPCELSDQVIGGYDANQRTMCGCDRGAPHASGAHASKGLFHRVILTEHQRTTRHDLIAEYLRELACPDKLCARDVPIRDYADRYRLIQGGRGHYHRTDVAFAHQPGNLGKGRRRHYRHQISTAQLADIHGHNPGGLNI